MTTAEIIDKINRMQLELSLLKSLLVPAKKVKRSKPDYSKQIDKVIMSLQNKSK